MKAVQQQLAQRIIAHQQPALCLIRKRLIVADRKRENARVCSHNQRIEPIEAGSLPCG
jgi:hypothetical protein